MFHLLWLIKLQHRICTVKAIVFTGEGEAVPGAEVFQLDPALPAAGVTAFHACRSQFRGIVSQLLPGFRRLLRI
ncbi:Uncharacterised protein [Salmonella enterica subsp. enterica serovar Bovismorbificans]|nr:Uncharacterised protein [Salmonella enterica subsp. enterica serovar Bovismorbificans]